MPGRPKAELVLEPEERKVLMGWARKTGDAGPRAQRARVVLFCSDGMDNKSVAIRTGVGEQTVSKWRRRFIAERLLGLRDQPRSGAPPSIAIGDVQRTVTTTLESQVPEGRWTTRSLARALGLSQSTVSRIWRAFGIQSRNAAEPAFADEVCDVLGIFVRANERVIAVVAGQQRTAPAPKVEGQRDRRPGSLLGKLRRDEPLGTITPDGQAATELGGFVSTLSPFLASGEQLYLVVAGCGRHAGTLWRWLEQDPRHHLHFVSSADLWLDLVDRWFARLTGAPLGFGMGFGLGLGHGVGTGGMGLESMPSFARYVVQPTGALRPLGRNLKPPDSR